MSSTRTTRNLIKSFSTCYIRVLASHTENDDTERGAPIILSYSKQGRVSVECIVSSQASRGLERAGLSSNLHLLLELLHVFSTQNVKAVDKQIENY